MGLNCERMINHQLINATSGDVEYFSPLPIVDAARRVMGSIDLDPASSVLANERINARNYFTRDDDGLKRSWVGNCWVNHPFHAGWSACDEKCQRKTCHARGHIYHDIPSNADWVRKMTSEYVRMEVLAITCITFAATSEEWFQPLMEYPQCYLSPRTNFYLPDGTLKHGVSKGSVVTYMGPAVDKFALEFAPMGTIKVKYEPKP